MELDAGGIAVSHGVGDALHGDLGKAVRRVIILGQLAAELHGHIHTQERFPQPLQAVGRARPPVLTERRGKAAGEIHQ